MNYSLEDAVMSAKANAIRDTGGIAVSRCGEYAIVAVDFSKPANNATGAKKTGLMIQPGNVVADGVFRANSAIAGTFNVQLNAAGDVLASQANPAANARVALTAAANNSANPIELLVNVTATASAGLGVIIARILPF